MTLQLRISGALLLLTAGAVVLGTWLHLLEVSRQLEGTLERQANRFVSSVLAEIAQSTAVLDEEIAFVVRGGGLERWFGGPARERMLAARSRLESGRVDILKLVDPTGTILLSGHWPSSFGALDPTFDVYQGDPSGEVTLIEEATPTGATTSIQRWARIPIERGELVVVSGRFLDADALDRLRVTVGADLLALCRRFGPAGTSPCVVVGSDDAMLGMPFDARDTYWDDRYLLAPVPLEGANEATLIVGLDRKPIDAVREGIVRRAIVVGAISVILAVLIGFLLARRVVKPIEALASAAVRLADGDLSVRVDVDGQPAGQEVTRLVDAFNKMAADIARSQNDLRQAERVAAWREIARGLAHELKNPLTPIRGAMDVIRRAHKLGRDDFAAILDEQASAVEEEVLRLKELADAFARFARLPDPNPEPLDARGVLDKAIALYVPDDGRIEVRRDYASDARPLWADRTQLATAVTNLVKNAVEAISDKGRLTVRVHLVEVEGAPFVEIAVEDSGAGIAPAVKERLFTPYVTTKGSRGTGLGLALVHRIVVEHRGRIESGVAEDGGARFTIRIPETGLRPDDETPKSTVA
jgi:two-component system nitrogen regulation sensor histidine kinase NtrY